MEDIEIKTCPFCGKYVMCSPDEPPEDVCDCPEAQHKRESAMRFEKLKTAIETSCGEGCEKLYPLHKPLKEDQLTAVVEIAAMVAKELLHSASLVLADGTSLKITGGKVERKASSKYSESN
jgi:hypothetical protein